jgi:glycosyltransferase involved in cell wall biosynthesis
MVFIEAQAMGLPVVSTRSGGIPEAVKDGETGLLVAERDPWALADAILRLMQDDELWKRYSLAGRKRVVDNFNLVKQTRRLEYVFEQLLAGREGLSCFTHSGDGNRSQLRHWGSL